jgi:hypothetical protein
VLCAALVIEACGTRDQPISGPVFDTGSIVPLDVGTVVDVADLPDTTTPSFAGVLTTGGDSGSLLIADVGAVADLYTPPLADAGPTTVADVALVPDAYIPQTADAGPPALPDVASVPDVPPAPTDAVPLWTVDTGTVGAIDTYVPPPLTKAQLLALGDKLLKGATCLKKDSPTCPGADVQAWQLEDFQDSSENKANYKKVYGLKKFKGKVIVMALLSAW